MELLTQYAEISRAWLQALPANQIVALVLFLFLLWIFNINISNKLTKTYNGYEEVIYKENKWPERVVKVSWIYLAFKVDNLWWAFGLSFASMLIIMFMISNVPGLLSIFAPEIKDEEMGSNSFGGRSRNRFPKFNRVQGPF